LALSGRPSARMNTVAERSVVDFRVGLFHRSTPCGDDA
jgi:hypothetical protein